MVATSGDHIALQAIRRGSRRQDSTTYFLDAIRHHVYAGDTGLHIAAAAYQRGPAHLLTATVRRYGRGTDVGLSLCTTRRAHHGHHRERENSRGRCDERMGS